VVRENFQKVLDCRTLALGAEVYASDSGERKSFPHTYKSRACSSCGQRATLCWQHEADARLPDIPYAGVLFTMPSDFWPIFQQNRHLLDSLPTLGAGVLQDWAEERYGAEVAVLVVCHTFGGDLKFNPHLHILVSTVGLHKSGRRLVSDVHFPKDAMMRNWRYALLDYLTMALESGQLASEKSKSQLRALFQEHRDRWWKAGVRYLQSKNAFSRYISRYLRRPPLATSRLLPSEEQKVRFLTKDRELGQSVITSYTDRELIARLADQVPDRYRHAVRYFGLLAPRSFGKSYAVFWALLGQRRRPRPGRIPWAQSIRATFGRDPLLDSEGERMYWMGRIPPVKRGPT
jgi:hypothetical protein